MNHEQEFLEGAGLDRCLDVAKQAASQAGQLLLASLDGVVEVQYKKEGHKNPVSQVDKQAESIILSIINDAFPDHGLISEETGRKDTSSVYTWIIDPLDGTINFIHKYRYFGVSIALSYQQDIVLGVIYNPVLDELFTAIKDNGAHLNGRRIQTSKIVNFDKSLLSMGFPYDRDSEAFHRSTRNFIRLVRDSQALRRDGSAALGLCGVACGRYDGYCVVGDELWDYAAGTLIVTEAGGRVTDFSGNLFRSSNSKSEVLATNGIIHEIMLEHLREVE